jgi:hypothetical protein
MKKKSKSSEFLTEHLRRVIRANALRKNCRCPHTANGLVLPCPHYNLAIVYPQCIQYWCDDRNIKKCLPHWDCQFRMSCRSYCGEPPKMITLGDFIKQKGCSPNCENGPIRISHGSIPYNSSVASNSHLMKFWSYENKANPRQVPITSLVIYKWTCEKGHKRDSPPSEVVDGDGCNFCSAISWPEALRRCIEKYGDKYKYIESSYTKASAKFMIICSEHGEFSRKMHEFVTRSSECPECMAKDNDSIGIRVIKVFLTELRIEHKPEIRFTDLRSPITNSMLPYDIVTYPIVIRTSIVEYDGFHHFAPVELWGGQDAFVRREMYDLIKDKYAISKGFNLIRLPYWIKAEKIKEILKFVMECIQSGLKIYISYDKYSKHVETSGYIVQNWEMPKKHEIQETKLKPHDVS